MKEDPRTPCNRQTLADGKFFTCPGTYEVRVAAYFDRSITEGELKLTFTTLGGGEGTEGVVINCTDCGEPAPRIFYAGIAEPLRTLEEKIMEALA
ncbi:hypothetical protein ACWEDZ_02815 [Streptomyces sp. NPDC005047]